MCELFLGESQRDQGAIGDGPPEPAGQIVKPMLHTTRDVEPRELEGEGRQALLASLQQRRDLPVAHGCDAASAQGSCRSASRHAGRFADHVARACDVQAQHPALIVDGADVERTLGNDDRVRAGLTLAEDHAPGRHPDLEGERVDGAGHAPGHRHHSCRVGSVGILHREGGFRTIPATTDNARPLGWPSNGAGGGRTVVAKHKLDIMLASVPLFEGLSKRRLKKIAALGETATYAEGTALVSEGGPGDSFFVAITGQAKVTVANRTVHRILPGDHFGEISLLDGGERTATVTSETPMTVLTIQRPAFLKAVEGDPDVAIALLESLARMIRRVDRSLAR